MADLVVAGAGMAGLAAAARARELGASVAVFEKGDRPGGSMRLSSCVVWRYRDWQRYRSECPDGDEALQRLVYDELDDALRWLESLGAPVQERDTPNPLTTGFRFDPQGLTAALARRAGEIRLSEPLVDLALAPDVPVLLATGGFQGDRELVRQHVTPWADELRLRANPWSRGDGLRLGLAAGGRLGAGLDQFYGRNVPAAPGPLAPSGFRAQQQLYARFATVENERGERYEARTWSEIDVVQWTARQPRARAWYVVEGDALGEVVLGRTVREMVDAAEAAGGRVERRDGGVAVEVVPGITTTLGGLAVDVHGRVAGGVYAAGADVGGFATGGYDSGLAAALVLGRRAAEAALGGS